MPMVTVCPTPEGVADGEHDVADDDIVHLAEADGRQLEPRRSGPICKRRDRSQGRCRRGAAGFRLRPSPSDTSICRPFDDMVVGQDVAVGADDDPEPSPELFGWFGLVASRQRKWRKIGSSTSGCLRRRVLRGEAVYDRRQFLPPRYELPVAGRPGWLARRRCWTA